MFPLILPLISHQLFPIPEDVTVRSACSGIELGDCNSGKLYKILLFITAFDKNKKAHLPKNVLAYLSALSNPYLQFYITLG